MKKIHYSWYICAACVLMLFACMGMGANGFSIFMPMIQEAYDLTSTQVSSFITIRNLVCFCAMFSVGLYYDKLGYRAGTTLATLFAAAAYIGFSISRTYIMFCISTAVMGLAYCFGTMIPAAILMNKWFVKNRALALSICGAGTGVAMIILPPISTGLVKAIGLSATFRAEGIFIIVTAVFVALIIRSNPEDMGLKPLGFEENSSANSGADRAENAGGQAEKAASAGSTPAVGSAVNEGASPVIGQNDERLPKILWATLITASMLMGSVASVGYAHLSVLYSSAGFDSGYIAAMISGIGLLLTLGKLLFGYMTDRIGGYKTSMIFWIFLIAGDLLCCFAYAGSHIINIIVAFTLGIGYALSNLGTSVWSNDMGKGAQYAKLVRYLQISMSGGALITSNVPGILADLSGTGSYLPAYIMFTVFCVVSAAFTAISYIYYGRKAANL